MAENGLARTIDTGVADDVRRLVARRTELGQRLRDREDAAVRVARARRLARDAADVPDLDAAERIIGGANEMVPVNFLERGVAACRSVARVSRSARGSRPVERLGSGFLVSPRLLITNHHVLRTPEGAAGCFAEFGVEDDVAGNQQTRVAIPLRPDSFFETSDDRTGLDVSVVALSDVEDEPPGRRYGYLTLAPPSDPVTLGEYLNVVQHPRGREKHVSFRENRLLDRRTDTLWYETDTDRGSSGSPVLDDQWLLVAVHRRSVPMRNENNEAMKVDGTVYVRGEPEDDVLWVANEGVRVEQVIEWLRGLPLDGDRAELRAECLAG